MIFALDNHMAYLPRYSLVWDGAIFHVTWQCHNKDWLIQEDWAKETYYNLLLKYKDRYSVSFFSYHFMDNHIHLSGKINGTKEQFSDLFRTVNSLLARKVNKELNRRGQVIMDRFKSPIIQEEHTLLRVMHYQDLNSTRAGMVNHPKDYRWSSYHHYACGEKDPLITEPQTYLNLGETPTQRQKKYREKINRILKEENLIKKDYSQKLYLGDPHWVDQKNKEIKQIKKAKRQAYLKRQQRLYHSLSNIP